MTEYPPRRAYIDTKDRNAIPAESPSPLRYSVILTIFHRSSAADFLLFAGFDMNPPDYEIQISQDRQTIWVHSGVDGSTVGRFSFRFGMDVHTTVTQQLSGQGQCLRCTHEPSGHEEWVEFCSLMAEHHNIHIDPSILGDTAAQYHRPST